MLALCLGAGALLLALPGGRYALRLSMQPRPTHLPVPVRGVAARGLADTWGAARSGGRHHQGIDIFARAGTPIYNLPGGATNPYSVLANAGSAQWGSSTISSGRR